jgi:hypothetical protein
MNFPCPAVPVCLVSDVLKATDDAVSAEAAGLGENQQCGVPARRVFDGRNTKIVRCAQDEFYIEGFEIL